MSRVARAVGAAVVEHHELEAVGRIAPPGKVAGEPQHLRPLIEGHGEDGDERAGGRPL